METSDSGWGIKACPPLVWRGRLAIVILSDLF